MKRTVLTLIAACFAAIAFGQKNEPFCCVTPGAELTYLSIDAKGKETGTSVTKIKSVSGSDGNYNMTQVITMYANGAQLLQPVEIKTTIKDGNASVALGGGMVVEVDGAEPIIPSNMEVGQELETGEMTVTMGIVKAKQNISSNKVVAKEEITVPAGTFDCYVVMQEYTASLGPLKVKGSQKTWYARGVGNVKSETYDKKGKLTSSQVLKEFKK